MSDNGPDEFGKPRLMPRQGFPLQFNASHSGDLILIAITMGRAVGVDVERIRATGLLRAFFLQRI
jgi:4'-phosphopantetheinyl transferase